MAPTQMQLEDWLDDLCVRFIINLPQEDLSSVARICFQVEEAQWFYEDFIRPLDPSLPSMSLRTFCLRIFQHCPLLASFSVENHTKAFEEFLQYKTRVPVRGAIMLNHAMDSVVLVKGWKKGANWSFPRGKINKDEDDLDCAVREVYEETGLDLGAVGLVPNGKRTKYIEIAMREQQLRLYVFRDIPMDTHFQPRTRKEISKIQWYKLSELPTFRKRGAQNQTEPAAASSHANNNNKFYMVAPFLVPLKKWIASQKKLEEPNTASAPHKQLHHQPHSEEAATTEDDSWAPTQHDAPNHGGPAVGMLDGATRELQRLLKMQPSTQGLQPAATHEDKGVALLSLLQANTSQTPSTRAPQTSQDVTAAAPPQPRHAHHPAHQYPVPFDAAPQGPAPAFHAAANQSLPSWNPTQVSGAAAHGPPNGIPNHAQYDGAMHQQAALVHPQPIPQVQRAMFGQSTFPVAPRAPQAIDLAHGRQDNRQPSHGQVPREAHGPPSSAAVQLNGQSMALLNAFKRDSAPNPSAPSKQDGRHREAAAPSEPSASSMPSYSLAQVPPNLLHRSDENASHQKSALELAGTAVEAPTDVHRSALLGMFKTAGPDVGRKFSVAKSTVPGGEVEENDGVPLQNPHSGDGGSRGPPPVRQPLLHSGADAHASASGSGPWESMVPRRPSNTHDAVGGNAVGGSEPPAWPTHVHSGLHVHKEQHAPAMTSTYGPPGQPHTGQMGNPDANSAPPPGGPNRRPEPSKDQKRQLLSLFGKQGSSSPGMAPDKAGGSRSRVASVAAGGGEQPCGALSSARRGTETPLSPADQTFLLEYLHTVTNNTAR
ncbi:hypothetical protein RJ55_03465 [Drechmeria coniospora]|nr:hypothetical protein RJ55_03465 [Drechmeria coniospora]